MNPSVPPQPPGGFGGGPAMPPAFHPPQPKSSAGAAGLIAVFVGLALVSVIGVLAVLGIYGVRKYIGAAKQAEARNNVTVIAKNAIAAYENEDESPALRHRLCPTTTKVPTDLRSVSARKYQSSYEDWHEPGWQCLHFELGTPQYFQYQYRSKRDGFDVVAHGDLDGDGTPSLFAVGGRLSGDLVTTSPMVEQQPNE